MTKIFAPNKQYTGLSASVSFVNGEGGTDRPELIEWFEKHGYRVEDIIPPNVPDNQSQEDNNEDIPDETQKNENSNSEEEPEVVPDLEDMPVDDLINYAKEHSIDLGKSTSKDGILKKIYNAEK